MTGTLTLCKIPPAMRKSGKLVEAANCLSLPGAAIFLVLTGSILVLEAQLELS